jgi:hypothetical protein
MIKIEQKQHGVRIAVIAVITMLLSVIGVATPKGYVGIAAGVPDGVGIYHDGHWFLRRDLSTGGADITVVFGNSISHPFVPDYPVVGDWNGDGVDTIGMYRVAQFVLSNSNTSPRVDYYFTFGNPGDRPLVGDWVGAGSTAVGTFRPSDGLIYKRYALSFGFDDNFNLIGTPGDMAVVGDWDANGTDTIGLYRPANGVWYLSNTNHRGFNESQLNVQRLIGLSTPVVGDWNGDGAADLGYHNPATGVFVTYSKANFAFGPSGSRVIPVSGRWGNSATPGMLQGLLVGSQQDSTTLENDTRID